MLLKSGRVYVCGSNEFGQLGYKNTEDRNELDFDDLQKKLIMKRAGTKMMTTIREEDDLETETTPRVVSRNNQRSTVKKAKTTATV